MLVTQRGGMLLAGYRASVILEIMPFPRLTVPTVVVGYGLIATATAFHAYTFGAGGRSEEAFLVFLADHQLAILPWIPATFLSAARVRRAMSLERLAVMTRIGFLVLFGIAVVGVINLAQAALLTGLGSHRGNPVLDVFAVGLMSVGPFGYVWYALVVIAAFAIQARAGPVVQPASAQPSYSHALEVDDGPARRVVPARDINWIEARADYVRIHTEDGSFLKRGRMKALEKALDPGRFARVHRSAIVNLERIRSFRHLRRGDYELELESRERLRLARSRRAEVLERLRKAQVPRAAG